jgi:hypothetical protein
MGREEQIEEREVLDSIFPEEIQGQLSHSLTTLPVPQTTTKLSSTANQRYRYIRDGIPHFNSSRHCK